MRLWAQPKGHSIGAMSLRSPAMAGQGDAWLSPPEAGTSKLHAMAFHTSFLLKQSILLGHGPRRLADVEELCHPALISKMRTEVTDWMGRLGMPPTPTWNPDKK